MSVNDEKLNKRIAKTSKYFHKLYETLGKNHTFWQEVECKNVDSRMLETAAYAASIFSDRIPIVSAWLDAHDEEIPNIVGNDKNVFSMCKAYSGGRTKFPLYEIQAAYELCDTLLVYIENLRQVQIKKSKESEISALTA